MVPVRWSVSSEIEQSPPKVSLPFSTHHQPVACADIRNQLRPGPTPENFQFNGRITACDLLQKAGCLFSLGLIEPSRFC